MRKLFILFICLIFMLSLTIPVFAVEGEPVPESEYSLYEWADGLWSYIFPPDVISANADLFTLFTLVAVSLIVFVPLFVIFCGLIFAFGSFFRRRE